MGNAGVAVQLWTLRDEIAEDLAGTLRQVAAIGYDGIELWFAEWPPVVELKAAIEDSDLAVAGAHVPFTQLRDGFQAVADYHHELGNSDLVIPIIPEELRETEDAWKRRVDEIAEIGRQCNPAGFRLSYHNHGIEFEDKIGDLEVHDYIFSTIEDELLKVQIDTYFPEALGRSPAEYVRKYAGRVPLLHIKDKSRDSDEGSATEIGRGVVDWDAVFAAAGDAGVEWLIVEQNCEVRPALESVKISYDYLRSRGDV